MTSIPGFVFATVNSKPTNSTKYLLLFHGTSEIGKEQFLATGGLPAKGSDIELIRHVEPVPGSFNQTAFRGTCEYPSSPTKDSGACFWAGDGGWIYEIHSYPGYDINHLLKGRVPNGKGGFRDPLMVGEQEIAIPAIVPRSSIPRFGRVAIRPRGPSVDWEVT